MTTLIIARHGNTFEQGETPRRIGARTDLPLTEAGRSQAKAIGQWLKLNGIYPEAVYSSQLKRTIQTATIALAEAGYKEPVFPLAIFNEIDYGPDENQPESAVAERIGPQALKNWDERGGVPEGWNFDPTQCILDWRNFTNHIVDDEQACVMVVTSNGIARFVPYITEDFEGFAKKHSLKLPTGSVAVFVYENGQWICKEWGVRPVM